VAVSSEVADNSRAHRMATEPKLMVIENGIDLGRYQPRSDLRAAVRAELGLSAGALVMGTVCRLVEGKNVGLLLRAALPHLGPETHVLIIGGGPDRAALEAMVRAHPQEDPFTSSPAYRRGRLAQRPGSLRPLVEQRGASPVGDRSHGHGVAGAVYPGRRHS